MASFNNERYEEIKKILNDNKISSKDLAQYSVYKRLKYLRHRQEIDCTDEEIEAYVNQQIKFEDLRKGQNWTENTKI